MPVMRQSISSIIVRPSISNTDTITSLKLTTPASDYSMVENPILYGGSTLLNLSSNQDISSFFGITIPESNASEIEIELYVLNSCIVIWLGSFNKGVQIEYRSLILHALTKMDHQDCIYLQVEAENNKTDLENTYEFFIKPSGKGDESNGLFKEMNLLDIISDTYQALTVCTSFHLDPTSSEDEHVNDMQQSHQPSFPILDSTRDITLMETDQDNVADDLNNEDICDDGINGGMIVDIGSGPVVGIVRGRDELDEMEIHKSRKLK